MDLLPGAAFERDPTIDYRVHKAVLHTMATCHSLRAVNGDLVGDPLDIKMFEFTQWSFHESGRKISTTGCEELDDVPASIARPPGCLECGPDDLVSPSKMSSSY